MCGGGGGRGRCRGSAEYGIPCGFSSVETIYMRCSSLFFFFFFFRAGGVYPVCRLLNWL